MDSLTWARQLSFLPEKYAILHASSNALLPSRRRGEEAGTGIKRGGGAPRREPARRRVRGFEFLFLRTADGPFQPSIFFVFHILFHFFLGVD